MGRINSFDFCDASKQQPVKRARHTAGKLRRFGSEKASQSGSDREKLCWGGMLSDS